MFGPVSVPLPPGLTASTETTDLLTRVWSAFLRAFQSIEPTEQGGGREYVAGPHGIYRAPSGRKRTGYGKEMELGAFANITETTVNKGFGEVHNGHSSQKSPTNSADGAESQTEGGKNGLDSR